MSDQRSTFLASLASRYNLADSLNWQPLIRHFELGRGFAFIVLLVPNDDVAEVCRAALDAHLRESGKHVQQIPIVVPDDLKQLAGTLLEMQPEAGAGAIWVARAVPEAVPHYQTWFEAWREGVARLNQFRNPLRRQFDIPLIFVGAPWLQQVLRNNAPDLWSVQTLAARVTAPVPPQPAADGIPLRKEPAVGGRGPDPELALAEANRLRGKEGTELDVARLLHRAGLGFAARNQWHEAVEAFSEALDIRCARAAPEDVAESGYQLGMALAWVEDLERAAAVLEQARAGFERAGDRLGTASCLQRLGDIAFRRGDWETAGARYQEALKPFRSSRNTRGEADCLSGVGDVALRESDHKAAETMFAEALRLYRQTGDVRGEGNSLSALGDVAFRCADYETARARYDQAMPLYRRILDRRGKANSLVRFGDIESVQGNRAIAEERYHNALRLFSEISDQYSIGLVHQRLATVTGGKDRESHLAAARAAWARIGRQDLIESLELEPALTSETPPATSPK